MKVQDLPVKARVYNKHKNVVKCLWLITWIIFLPVVILQVINDGLEFIVDKFATLRSEIVYTTFKIIYKKEIIKQMKEVE